MARPRTNDSSRRLARTWRPWQLGDSTGLAAGEAAEAYLKATGHRLGLLINLNVPVLRSGLKRIILS